MKKEFKYYPEDFKEPAVKVIHMDLVFDVYDKYTKANSDLKLKSKKSIKHLELNAKNLEIHKLKCNLSDSNFEYDLNSDKVVINFRKEIPADTEFIISIETTCKPTNNVLEGLYYDETPDGAPPTQITQCQQWGFQRLVPCIDEMTAKCTYKTTIIADSRYTNIITNGDVAEQRTTIGKGRDKIVYDNTKTPMAPYLFFLGVGTYSTFTREFEYPDGYKFDLEILAPIGTNKELGTKALDILFNAIMWVHLFTGPGKYENLETKKRIYSLINKREELKNKAGNDELNRLREELNKISTHLRLGYKYTGTVYREIGMQNSNFGGMENVGNTTITTNRLLPFKEMTDGSFEYMIQVKVHEFYHNLNGSEVTGWSPFEIWLNEAVTVHIEKEYLSELLSEEYIRLGVVLSLIAPGGTFDKDSGVLSMPIEPDGFNNPDELITDVTYIKAPQFIRMIQTLMGKDLFVKGLDLYHRTYKHSNATRRQWVECMEKVSHMHFQEMSNTWLKQTNFPIVDITTEYKSGDAIVNISQNKIKDKNPWEFPLKIDLIDKNGKVTSSLIKRIFGYKDKVVFEKVPKPELISVNGSYSFYGKVNYKQSLKELYKQVKLDPDLINKYISFYKITETEKLKLLKDKDNKVSSEFVDLFYSILKDEDLTNRAGSLILAITQSVDDEKFQHKYQDLFEVREKILKTIAVKYKKELFEVYHKYSTRTINGDYLEKELFNIKNRQIKNTCLGLLTRLDIKEVHDLIKKQYLTAENFSDRIAAFGAYLRTSSKDKNEILKKEQNIAEKNLVHYEAFLSVIGGNESSDALEIIKKVEKSKAFRIEQTNCQRALYATFARNKRKSLLTKDGLDYITEILTKLSPINEYVAVQIMNILFGKIDYLDEKHQVTVIESILKILKTLDKYKIPSAFNNLMRILKNSEKSVKNYEKIYKKEIRV